MSPANVIFKYMYRDASNYKQHGEVVFTNQRLLTLEELEQRIRSLLSEGELFIARQVHIEELFFPTLYEDDHPWHEFKCIQETNAPACDPENWKQCQHQRDITEFLADLERAKRTGWDEMNVRPDLARQLERQKADLKRALEQGKSEHSDDNPDRSQS